MKKIKMYTLSTCPRCLKTKQWFSEHGVPFECTDYDLVDKGTRATILRELDAAGADGFPYLRVGNQVVEGYQPAQFARLLGSDRLESVLVDAQSTDPGVQGLPGHPEL